MGAAGGRYEGTLRDIIHSYKYQGRRSLARPLAALMFKAGSTLLDDADALVPVPLHPWRRLTRGFNQAADLAEHLGLPVTVSLKRKHLTASQASLPASARRANVDRVFELTDNARVLAHRVVVLVDDVRTTGATLEACAKALRHSGAREIRALTAALADLDT